MTYGKMVAEKWKRQYYDGRTKKWKEMDMWDMQPEEYHRVLLELRSKEAINALIGDSWTRRLKKSPVRKCP
ncbi:MAG: hypothetical protein V4568_14540 [Pseudomonadota bacterium]